MSIGQTCKCCLAHLFDQAKENHLFTLSSWQSGVDSLAYIIPIQGHVLASYRMLVIEKGFKDFVLLCHHFRKRLLAP